MFGAFVKTFFHGSRNSCKSPAQSLALRGAIGFYTPSLLRRMISASSGVVVEV